MDRQDTITSISWSLPVILRLIDQRIAEYGLSVQELLDTISKKDFDITYYKDEVGVK